MLCLPYSCDTRPGPAFRPAASAQGGQCDPQHSCDLSTGSCGKVGIGAHCNGDADCISGNCADSVCCNIACKGACVACNLPGRLGACSAIDSGKPDPRGVCKDQGRRQLRPQRDLRRRRRLRQLRPGHPVPRAVVHRQPPQHGGDVRRSRQMPAARRPGLPSVPLRRRRLHQVVPDGGRLRSGNRLPPRDDRHDDLRAQAARRQLPGASECSSNFCVDGVCCQSACSGTCQYCALPTSPGFCMTVAADNVDPRGVCQDKGAASCGTNGKCDGTGSCATYAKGRSAPAETCASGVFTAASTCNTTGQCVAPDSRPCAPYVCNGSPVLQRLRDQRPVQDAQHLQRDELVRAQGSGRRLRSTAECQTGLSCAQGYCCNSPCAGACQSCALSGSPGTCTNVPANQVDPAAQCVDKGRLLQTQRQVRRQRQLPALRAGDPASGRPAPAEPRPSPERRPVTAPASA